MSHPFETARPRGVTVVDNYDHHRTPPGLDETTYTPSNAAADKRKQVAKARRVALKDGLGGMQPKRGKVVVFFPSFANGEIDPQALHCAEDAEDGLAMAVWLRCMLVLKPLEYFKTLCLKMVELLIASWFVVTRPALLLSTTFL